jgi:hypothetical protein
MGAITRPLNEKNVFINNDNVSIKTNARSVGI